MDLYFKVSEKEIFRHRLLPWKILPNTQRKISKKLQGDNKILENHNLYYLFQKIEEKEMFSK